MVQQLIVYQRVLPRCSNLRFHQQQQLCEKRPWFHLTRELYSRTVPCVLLSVSFAQLAQTLPHQMKIVSSIVRKNRIQDSRSANSGTVMWLTEGGKTNFVGSSGQAEDLNSKPRRTVSTLVTVCEPVSSCNCNDRASTNAPDGHRPH